MESSLANTGLHIDKHKTTTTCRNGAQNQLEMRASPKANTNPSVSHDASSVNQSQATNLEIMAPVRPLNTGRGGEEPSALPQKMVVRRLAALASISDTQNAKSWPLSDTAGFPTSGIPIKASGVNTPADIGPRLRDGVAAEAMKSAAGRATTGCQTVAPQTYAHLNKQAWVVTPLECSSCPEPGCCTLPF